MNYSTKRTVGVSVLLAVASLVFALPVLGAGQPNDRVGPRGIDAATASAPVRPDDRAGPLGVGAVGAATFVDVAAVRPDDRGGARGPGAIPSGPPVSPVVVSRDAFQWDDATLAAGATLCVLLLAGAAVLTVRHRGRVIWR